VELGLEGVVLEGVVCVVSFLLDTLVRRIGFDKLSYFLLKVSLLFVDVGRFVVGWCLRGLDMAH